MPVHQPWWTSETSGGKAGQACALPGAREDGPGEPAPQTPGSPVPLFTLAPQGWCMSQFEAQWPEPRAMRDGADWCPVSEDAEFKDTKATGSWDQLGQQPGAAGRELRASTAAQETDGPPPWAEHRAGPPAGGLSKAIPPLPASVARQWLGVHNSQVPGSKGRPSQQARHHLAAFRAGSGKTQDSHRL